MNDRIVDFIEGQRVATICCVDEENKPYCFSCFFAFDKEKHLLYFKSSANTYHGPLLEKLPHIAGTIQPDKLNPLAIKGIQFSGAILPGSNDLCVDASTVYHKKYPFALAMPGDLWTVQLHHIKMTDNTLSFGKKITWKREQEEVMH